MATIIEQQPVFNSSVAAMPVGQPVIFAVSNNLLVANQIKVKFIAEVHISSDLPPVLSTTTHLVGTFKTTPNNKGVGMFDFRPIIESHIKADNLARAGSIGGITEYKGVPNLLTSPRPLHLIDKFSGADNILRWVAIKFKVEYLDQEEYLPGGAVNPDYNTIITSTDEANSESFEIFNGYVKSTDQFKQSATGVNFGLSMNDFKLDGSTKKFLTNAPATQYANITDYGTVGLLITGNLYDSSQNPTGVKTLSLEYYDSSDVQLATEFVHITSANGAFPWSLRANAPNRILYAGIYPANLRGWSSKFQTIVANDTISYYTVVAQTASYVDVSQPYRINVNCPTLKGYEPIRLTWLNQWGVWDYYTFNMKSTRKISTKGSTYNQLGGSWNESAYRLDSFKGGKKAFRVNSTEMITMNTDFVNESEGVWFEELINSPEVYMLDGYQVNIQNSALNQYVIPVRLTTSSYTKKTVANDRLMQYTFEVEKSKTLRTQSV